MKRLLCWERIWIESENPYRVEFLEKNEEKDLFWKKLLIYCNKPENVR